MNSPARKRRIGKQTSIEPPTKFQTPVKGFKQTVIVEQKQHSHLSYAIQSSPVSEAEHVATSVTDRRQTNAVTKTTREQMLPHKPDYHAISNKAKGKHLVKQGRLRSTSSEFEKCLMESLTSKFDNLKITGCALKNNNETPQEMWDPRATFTTKRQTQIIPDVPKNTPENLTLPDVPNERNQLFQTLHVSLDDLTSGNKVFDETNDFQICTRMMTPEVERHKLERIKSGSCSDFSFEEQHCLIKFEDLLKNVRRRKSQSDCYARKLTNRRNAIFW